MRCDAPPTRKRSASDQGPRSLTTLPETPERLRHELALQATLSTTLTATKGYASPDVERAQTRAFELCRQAGETRSSSPSLAGLWGFRFLRGAARGEGAGRAALPHRGERPGLALLLWGHTLQGLTLSMLGELPAGLRTLTRDRVVRAQPPPVGPDRVGAQTPK
jgi:hypothetical protein